MDSFMGTSFDSVNGISISTTYRDLSISADTGDANINGNIVNIVAGVSTGPVVFNTTGNVNLNSIETWNMDAQGDINLSSSGDLNLLSTAEFIDLRGVNGISFQAAATIQLATKNDIIYNVEDGGLNVNAATDLAYIGYTAVFNSTNGDVNVLGTGNDANVVLQAGGSVTTSDVTGVQIYSVYTADFTSRSSITVDSKQALQLNSNTGFSIDSYSVGLAAYSNFNINSQNTALSFVGSGQGNVVVSSSAFTLSSSASTASGDSFTVTGGDNIIFVTPSGFPGTSNSVIYGDIGIQVTQGITGTFSNTINLQDSEYIKLKSGATSVTSNSTNLVASAYFLTEILSLSGTNINITSVLTQTYTGSEVLVNSTNFAIDGTSSLSLLSSGSITTTASTNLNLLGSTADYVFLSKTSQTFAASNSFSLETSSTTDKVLFYGNSLAINTGSLNVSAIDANLQAYTSVTVDPSQSYTINTQLFRESDTEGTYLTIVDALGFQADTLSLKSLLQTTLKSNATSFTDQSVSFVSASGTIHSLGGTTIGAANLNFMMRDMIEFTSINQSTTVKFFLAQSRSLQFAASKTIELQTSGNFVFQSSHGGDFFFDSPTFSTSSVASFAASSGIISLDADSQPISITSSGIFLASSAQGSDIYFELSGGLTAIAGEGLQLSGEMVALHSSSLVTISSSAGAMNLLATREANFTSGRSIIFNAGTQPFTLAGNGTAYLNLADSLSIQSTGQTSIATCGGEIIFNFDFTTLSAQNLTLNSNSSCGTHNSSFSIYSGARVGQYISSLAQIYNSTIFKTSGGDIGFTTYSGPINFAVGDQLSISTSGNQNILLDNPRSLDFFATKDAQYTSSNGAISISTSARNNHNVITPYGIHFQTGDLQSGSPILFNSPSNSNTFTAAGNLFLGTYRPLSSGFVSASQDFVVGASDTISLHGSSVQLVSGSTVNTLGLSTRNNKEGVLFSAPIGDIQVLSQRQSIYFSSIGSQFTSNTSSISIYAGLNLNETALHDEYIGTNFGHIHFNIDKTIFITSGKTQRDGELSFLSTGDFSINTFGSQRYHSFGISSANNIQSISLLSQQGNFAINAALNLDIYAGGQSKFLSNAGSFQLTASDSIFFNNYGLFSVESTTDSTVTANTGSIYLTASGPNGGFSLVSDSNQSVDFLAGKSVIIGAGGNSTFLASTGIQAITNTGNLNIQNNGFGKNSLFHSGGNVVLQAGSTAGAFFYGRNFRWLAQNNVQIDASTVTVGSLDNTLTATHPRVNITAGGDDSHNGITLNSAGSIDWSTKEGSTILFNAYDYSLSANTAININSNGPISFENNGRLNSGSFLIQTLVGTLTHQGQNNAILDSKISTTLNSQNNFVISSSGTNPGNNMTIEASIAATFNANNAVSLNSNSAEFNFYDASITATSTVNIITTLGSSGSLSFNSNQDIVGSSVGSTSFTSAAPITIRTLGVLSPINFNTTTGSPINVNAGSELFLSGNDVLADGSNGLNITSTAANIVFQSTANTKFVANNTISLSARSSYIVTAGDSSTQSNVEIDSKGAIIFQAVNDVTLSSVALDPYNILSKAISINGDSGVTFQNLLASKSKNQGDITLISTLSNDFIAAQGNLLSSSGRDTTLALVNGPTTFQSGGQLSILTTGTGANIAFNLGQNLDLQGGAGFIVAAGNAANSANVLFSGQNLIINSGQSQLYPTPSVRSGFNLLANAGNIRFQVDNGGAFGITVNSYGSIASTGSTTLVTQGTFQINAAYEVTISAANAVNIQGYTSIAINVQDGDPLTTPGLASQRSSNFIIDGYLSNGNAVNLAGSSVTVSTDQTTSNFEIDAAQQLLVNAYSGGTSFTGQYIEMHSNGLDPTNTYAAHFQSSTQINFQGNNIVVASLAGSANITSREGNTIISNTYITATATNIMRVQSGFVQQPLAPLGPQRAGITISPYSNDALFIAESGNIVINAYDASFSTSGTLTVNAQQSQGRVVMTSQNINVASGGTLAISALSGQFAVNAAQALSSTAPTVALNAEGSLYALTNGKASFTGTVSISINAQSVYLNSPTVNFFPSGTEVLIIPPNSRARYNTHTTTYFEEPNYRGCKEKEFIFDIISSVFCFCYNNFWRCTA